jgi:hypothetical protein
MRVAFVGEAVGSFNKEDVNDNAKCNDSINDSEVEVRLEYENEVGVGGSSDSEVVAGVLAAAAVVVVEDMTVIECVVVVVGSDDISNDVKVVDWDRGATSA